MLDVAQLNYQHLFYFWVVAREESVTRASQRLSLAPSTVSAQIKQLEGVLNTQLFDRSHRSMKMTSTGVSVFAYADEIFSLGQQLIDEIQGKEAQRALRLEVGLASSIPKLVALKLLEPVLDLDQRVDLVCREDHAEGLLLGLGRHDIDVAIVDDPLNAAAAGTNAFHRLITECGVLIYGTPELLEAHPGELIKRLDRAPFLMPTSKTTLRRSLDSWFARHKIQPDIRAEFEDSALLKTFGGRGAGFFAAPAIVQAEVERQHGVVAIGELEGVIERFWAVSVERRIQHPAVRALTDAARGEITILDGSSDGPADGPEDEPADGSRDAI